jgi:hypothetical protein
MKVTFMAKKALDAYFDNSAVSRLVKTMGILKT